MSVYNEWLHHLSVAACMNPDGEGGFGPLIFLKCLLQIILTTRHAVR